MRVYVRLYRSHILVARVTLSSRFPRGGETAGASSALTLPAWWRKRKIDARGGPQWSPLVRDRLAFPCFLLCLSLRLAACACALHGPMMPAVFTRSRDQCALL